MPPRGQGRGGPRGGRGGAGKILHRFIAGRQSQDSAVSTALMEFPTKGHSFFTPGETRDIAGGLVLWRGYFQSIRPAIGRMLINVDISTGVMYQAGPLINLCLAFLGRNNPALLARQIPEREWDALGRFITHIRVQTQDSASRAVRARSVKRLTREGANESSFTMRNGRILTVAQYFQETSGRPLRFPSLLCVEVGQGALIPLELCTVLPGQLFKKEIGIPEHRDVLKAAHLDFATKRPKERLESICKGLQVLAYGQSEYVRKFGLTVDPTLVSTQVRVLRAPTLKYGPGKAPTRWADKCFFKPSTIAAWVLISFETQNRFNDAAANEVATSFVAGCRSTGITVTDPVPIIRRINGQGNIPRDLQAAGAACFQQKKIPPTLFVVVLPEGGNDLYTIVKHWGDVKKGVATQCLKSRKCTKAKIQFWENVALKINVKLGGINVITDPSQVAVLSDPHNPTVVMGADVMPSVHFLPLLPIVLDYPQSGNDWPPILRGCSLECRLECRKIYRDSTRSDLETRVDYRIERNDSHGVSEGEFQQVLDNGKCEFYKLQSGINLHILELPGIKAACQELKIDPRITLIIVGKRHHIRLFPINDKNADRSGNCPAGTVVDRDVGHPTEFDFYLQSHAGILGTSRPAHYSAFKFFSHVPRFYMIPDALQTLSYALCHVYARSTRSVSIPAPVYYADTVCAKAKIHFDPSSRDGTWSESGTTSASETLAAFKRDYMPLHINLAGCMYFS
ncbi:ribonuclease H-like domain-containing protein [Mycena leptocephala]|nr:ribonuclease H-like domain-containing protein [Mycena leptocephala]